MIQWIYFLLMPGIKKSIQNLCNSNEIIMAGIIIIGTTQNAKINIKMFNKNKQIASACLPSVVLETRYIHSIFFLGGGVKIKTLNIKNVKPQKAMVRVSRYLRWRCATYSLWGHKYESLCNWK